MKESDSNSYIEQQKFYLRQNEIPYILMAQLRVNFAKLIIFTAVAHGFY